MIHNYQEPTDGNFTDVPIRHPSAGALERGAGSKSSMAPSWRAGRAKERCERLVAIGGDRWKKKQGVRSVISYKYVEIL